MTEDSKKPSQSATAIVDNMEIFIPLKGIIDFDIEKKRLQKRIKELNNHLIGANSKLKNKEFLKRAQRILSIVKKKKKRIWF